MPALVSSTRCACLGLIRSAAGDVGQRPGGLELQHSVVAVAEELDEPDEEDEAIATKGSKTWARSLG